MAETNLLAAIGDTLTMKLPKATSALAIAMCVLSLGGSAGAVVQYEYSPDDGVTWFALSSTPLEGGAAAVSRNAVGCSMAIVGGITHVRMRLSALTSGGPLPCRINEVDY